MLNNTFTDAEIKEIASLLRQYADTVGARDSGGDIAALTYATRMGDKEAEETLAARTFENEGVML